MDPRPEHVSPHELTRFLNELTTGRTDRALTLMPYVYDQLRIIAHSHMRRPRGDTTLQPTELVHEAYLKLFDPEHVSWNDRKHFFALASKAMRQLMVDHARSRNRQKRGGGREELTLDEAFVAGGEMPFDLIDLDDALEALFALDERQGRIVELRYFGGLEVDQVAEVLSVSSSTVERDWRAARAWLGVRLSPEPGR